MSISSWVPTGLLVLLAAALFSGPSHAQQPDDSIRGEALQDFHGPDRTGKDGPLAKAGLDLLLLYHEYRTFRQQEGKSSFSPSLVGARVTDGHVTIDAIAKTTAQELREDLSELGLTGVAVAGRVVSGRLPVEQVPALARVESLRGVVLPRAKTHESHPPQSGTPGSASGTGPAVPPSSDESNTGGLLFFGGMLGTFALAEL